jgi:hypothetical protein
LLTKKKGGGIPPLPKWDENEAILSHSKSNLWALKTEHEHPTHGIFHDELDSVTFPWWLPTRCG